MLIDFVAKRHAGEYDILQVGTGDSPLTMPFYERCGFERSHVVEGFFTENYDHPIFEGDVQLVDMIYLRKRLQMRTTSLLCRAVLLILSRLS